MERVVQSQLGVATQSRLRAEGFVDAGPLGVAKHVDQVQIGRDKRLDRAVGRQGFNRASGRDPRQADSPLVHAQEIGAKGDLVLIDEPLGVGRPQELAHLDRSWLAILLALPAKPRASKPKGGRGVNRRRSGRTPPRAPRGACWHESVETR